MQDIILVFLYTIAILTSIVLIGLILLQPSKSGGFGSAFGGVGESVFGAQALGHLTKLTIILTVVFFITILMLVVVTGHRNSPKSIIENIESVQPATATNAPVATQTQTAPITAPVAKEEKASAK